MLAAPMYVSLKLQIRSLAIDEPEAEEAAEPVLPVAEAEPEAGAEEPEPVADEPAAPVAEAPTKLVPVLMK